ncbi:31354_t:CDS:2, partial [Gigaspora margarita]
ICVKRLKKKNIKKQLETHSILKDINMNRKELVKKLKLVLAKKTLEKTLECSSISSLSNYVQNLPKNKKSDTDSNIRHKYFLKDNTNKSERHTAKSMLIQLRQCVKNGIIEKNKVPKLETIQNWISHYLRQYFQKAVEIIA